MRSREVGTSVEILGIARPLGASEAACMSHSVAMNHSKLHEPSNFSSAHRLIN